MYRSVILGIITLLFAGVFMAGCSGGGTLTAPDSPGIGNDNPLPKEATSPENQYLRFPWDMGEVVLNPEKQVVNVLRPRGLDFNVDVLIFMQPPGGPKAVTYKINWLQSDFPNGLVDIDVTLTHPLPQNFYWGHDVRLVILGNGDEVANSDTTLTYAKKNQLRMLNPDGYTRWWNMVEFLDQGNTMFEYHEGQYSIGNFTATATLNPYKYFADSVGKDDYPPDIDEATRGEFRSGHTNKRHMILKFPKNPPVDFRFKYVVDASWQAPKNTPVDSSDDFGLKANCREAYQIKADTTGSTLYYNGPGDSGGDLHIQLEIFDWKQAGGTVEDEIGKISLASPTIFGNYFGFVYIQDTAIVTPGSSPNSVFYSSVITDCTPSSTEDQEILVCVSDAADSGYGPPSGLTPYPSGAALAAYNLFTVPVQAGPGDSITVDEPNGGESLEINGSYEIKWTSTGSISNVKIEYSTDGGATYPNEIIGSTPNDGSFDWDPIPDDPTDQAKVRISDADDALVSDVSDAVFEITTIPKNIQVLIPNGGEQWLVTSSHDITWSSEGDITTVMIEYFKDDDYGNAVTIVSSTANSGVFDWDSIPDDPSPAVKVRISDLYDPATYDDSDNFFAIAQEPPSVTIIQPNGGESWQAGTAQAITWSTTGDIPNVRIEYYKDDDYGTAVEIIDSTPNTGSFDWFPIPPDLTTTAKVRVSDAVAPGIYDDSDDYFEITGEPKYIEVTIPNGGEHWEAGGSHEITWLTDGPITDVKIEYYKNNDYDGTAQLIIDSTPNDGSFTWEPIPDDPTLTAKVRVSDVSEPDLFDNSDAFFELIGGGPKVLEMRMPVDGQKWEFGTSHEILWSTIGPIPNVKIEYYKDDDYAGTVQVIEPSIPNSNSYIWNPIPTDPTETARVRVSDASDADVYADSRPYLTLTDDSGWDFPISTFLFPQPNQGIRPPDITVHNQAGPNSSRGEIAVQEGPTITFYMFDDSYSSSTGWLLSSTSELIDITDYNHFDQTIWWDNVMALSNSNDVSPFPGNQFNDPGHSFVYFLWNVADPDPNAGKPIDAWIYGDGDPEGDIPPDNDPDVQPWLHVTDWDSGVAGGFGSGPVEDDVTLYTIITWSEHPSQPHPNNNGLIYPAWTTTGYSPADTTIFGLPNMVLDGDTPGPLDDSDPDSWRLAVDDDSHLLYNGLYPITEYYVLDSAGKVHMILMWYDTSIPSWQYIPYGEYYLGPDGALGIDFTGQAKDIVFLPANEAGLDTWNWLSVLVDTGFGWIVRIYTIDYTQPDIIVKLIHTTDLEPGVPMSMDADNLDFELHVVYTDGAYGVGVWANTQ